MSKKILQSLDELESLIASRSEGALFPSGEILRTMWGGAVKNEWRPVWEKQREIQNLFNDKPVFASAKEREEAWLAFNVLRDASHETHKAEKERLFWLSKQYRDWLTEDLRSLEYDPTDMMDGILGVSTEDIKRMSAKAKQAAKDLSDHSHLLTKDHKDELYQRLREIRASHTLFFDRQNLAWQKTQEERARKREAFVDNVKQRIGLNQERLAKAENALASCERNIMQNYEKLGGSNSSAYEERVRGWIEEAEERLQSIKETIERIKKWIEDDEEKI